MRRNPLLLGMLCLGFASTASADWMRDYDRGLRAISKQDWQEAENHFRAAIRQKQAPESRQRFQGQRFEPYVPHYYAGLAAWQRGDCSAAMEYWEQPGNLAVVRELPALNGEQERGLSTCRQQLAAASAPASEPAAVAATAPATAATASPTAAKPTPATPEQTRPATVAAKEPASTAPAATVPAVAAQPKSPPTQLRPATAAPTAGTAPMLLNQAIEHYLAGRYAELVRLDPASVADSRGRAQLLLLRAAARYLQVELDGGDGFDTARADIRAAKAANAALSPDSAMFPPRFRSFWQQTR